MSTSTRGPVSSPEESAPVRAFEPNRLRRAVALLKGVERAGPRQYRVRGQDEPEYAVSLDGDPPCYCADYYHRGSPTNPCKHILAARLVDGDMALIQSLGELLLTAERARGEA
jgi:hypothetical protein